MAFTHRFSALCASALTVAALSITTGPAAISPASAAMCGDTINTTWSAPSDINTTTNELSLVACSTSSTLAGDGIISGGDPDPYSVSVSAIDDDTFQLRGSIDDLITGIGDSPFITLVLSDIDWVGGPGSITDVIAHAGAEGTFGLDSFTADTITISGSFACVGAVGCSLADVDLGTFDVVASHDIPPVPLPAAGWMFLTALGGLALYGRRRRARR